MRAATWSLCALALSGPAAWSQEEHGQGTGHVPRSGSAAEAPPAQIEGVVEGSRPGQLVVRGSDAKVVPFRVDSATRYEESGRPPSPRRLARGRHVVVHFRTEGSEFVAERIVIQPRAKAADRATRTPGHAASGGAGHAGMEAAAPMEQGMGEGMAHDMGGMDEMKTPLGGPFRSAAAIGSGTSLLPATSPEYGWHRQRGAWMLMAHGDLRAGFNRQGGPRGVSKVESQNWLMGMAERDLAGGRLTLRGMFSAEEWTAPRQGFPQLLQTGETLDGQPLIDSQHVHDLFMELAVAYAHPLSDSATVHIYGGPAAEPALGPTAFPHRISAGGNPAATLGHHVQDSTHITHGVITGGLTVSRVRIEGSVFRGKEPDEKRTDLELGPLDSWSGRIAFTPSREWALQVSHGRLNEPEASEPGDIDRTTASVMYTRSWADGYWASAAVWGRNAEEHGNFNSYLLESALTFRRHHQVYGRLELLDKDGLLQDNIFDKPGLSACVANREACEGTARVGAVTLGAVHEFVASGTWTFGIGGDVTVYHVPGQLEAVYGSSPMSVHAYLRLRPGRMESAPPDAPATGHDEGRR